MKAKLSALSFLLVLGITAAPAPAARAQEASAEQTEAGIPLPETLEQALEHDLQEIRGKLEGRPVEELAALLTVWERFITQEHKRFEAAYGMPTPEGERGAATIAADRDLLMEGADTIADVLQERGVDVSQERALLAAIDKADLARNDQTFALDVVSAEEIPSEVLKAFLRPLTKAQVEVQLATWLELLQRKCMVVRNVEIAAMLAESEKASGYYERALLMRQEREDLIERVNLVIDALEEKGGDVAEHRAYTDSAVEAPPITGFTAMVATFRTWLTSSEGGLALALNIGAAIATLLAAWMVAIVLARIVGRAMLRLRNVSGLLRQFVVMAAKRVTIFLGFLGALAQLGVNMTPLIAAIGAAGLILGLALQGTLSNLASGIMIMVNRPFDVGDLISTSGTLGYVRGMTLITTRVETLDNQIIYVPNNMIWSDVITNVTANKTRRVDMVFGIAYGDDQRKAQKILQEVVAAHPKVLEKPEPMVRVHELGDSSVNFAVRPWVATEDYWDVYWDLTEKVKERFDEEGVSIPFPQRDVHHYYEGQPASGPELRNEELQPKSSGVPTDKA